MADEEWVLVENVQGQLQAEILKGLLEAQGIMVWVNPQGASHGYAVTVGSLGLVELLVPTSQVDQARQVLDAYYRGDFKDIEFKTPDTDQDPQD